MGKCRPRAFYRVTWVGGGQAKPQALWLSLWIKIVNTTSAPPPQVVLSLWVALS